MESSDAKINIAYIDAANLDRAIRDLHWKLDYKKFRIWLADKYKVERAYIFIGLIPKYNDFYTYFQECCFTLVFKEVVYQGSGVPKGNCDTDLIMQAIDDAYEGRLEKALLVSSDGDYAPLVKKLQVRNQFLGILSPAPAKKCSILLKRTNAPIAYVNDQKKLLQIK